MVCWEIRAAETVLSSRFTSASKWGHIWGHIPNFEGPHFQMPPNMPPDDHESIDGCGRAQCATEDSALQALDRRRPLTGGDADRRQGLADEGPHRSDERRVGKEG